MKILYLLDTNVVCEIALERPNPKLLKKIRTEAQRSAICAPVWQELTYGLKRLPNGARRTKVEAFLTEVVHGSFPILAYDEVAAAWHGAERARLEKAGTPGPFVDGQIAAIAFVNGLQLVTNNEKDFRRFKGLSTVNWKK